MKKSTQIGGKGTMRRKKIPANFKRHFNQKKTQEQIHFENRLQKINQYLLQCDNEYKQVAIQGQNNIILSHFDDLERHDVKKKDIFKLLRHDVISYFDTKFINKEPEYQYKTYIYTDLKDIFTNDCMPYILDIFVEIENYFEKKKYLNEEKDVVEMGDKECFEILGLDYTGELTKDVLKSAYKQKSRENHPDKHQDEREKYEDIFSKISVAYKLLKNRYKI